MLRNTSRASAFAWPLANISSVCIMLIPALSIVAICRVRTQISSELSLSLATESQDFLTNLMCCALIPCLRNMSLTSLGEAAVNFPFTLLPRRSAPCQ